MSAEQPDPTSDRDFPADEKQFALTTELVAFLDGELDARGAERMGTKISLDPQVRAEADAFKRTWDLLDHLPRPEPSPSFTERTLSKIEPPRTQGKLPGRAGGSNGLNTLPTEPTEPTKHESPPARRRARLRIVAKWFAAVLLGGIAGYVIEGEVRSSLRHMEQAEMDAKILAERRLLLNLRNYRHVDDLKFLESLDNPDLFGDEYPNSGSEAGR